MIIRRTAPIRLLSAFLLTAVAPPLHAQVTDPADTPTPAQTPPPGPTPQPAGPEAPEEQGLTDPSVDRVAEELRVAPLEAPAVEPTRPPVANPVTPGVGLGPDDLADLLPRDEWGSPRLMRERSFLVRERASILRASTGEWIAVFHAGARPNNPDAPRRPAAPPMVLLPSPTLDQLETTAAGRGLDVAYRLTGEVMRYQNRNYLFPTAFGVEPVTFTPTTAPDPDPNLQPTDPPAPDTADPGAPSSAPPAVAPSRDPSVEALIADLESRREVARGLARPPARATPVETDDADSAEEAVSGLLPAFVRDGDLLVRRRGRMTRLAGGEWAFVVDADTDASAAALAETPLVLLPCRTLERMERAAQRDGDGVAFELTGRLTAYAGRAYVLPTLAVQLPEDSLSSLQ